MLRDAILAWPEDVRVAVIASGGLSHFVNDEEFDRDVIGKLAAYDYDGLAAIPDSYYQSGTSEVKIYSIVMMALQQTGAQMTLVDYVPCWRTAAGTGEGMGFMYWDASQMTEVTNSERLNGVIRAFESGKPAFTCFAKLDSQAAIEMTDAPYDGIVFEMEHNPYDVAALGDCLQYMLNRKTIAASGSVAPSVTPLARIPANGCEMNQFQAKQVLDRGVYGVIIPHVWTIEQAYNAVASCRYARPKNAPLYEPKGRARRRPGGGSALLGAVTQAEYYAKADVWPLAPHGELLVGLMIESPEAIENLDDMLANVPGHRLLPDRRGRSQPGARLSAPVRASRSARRDERRSSRPATSTRSWSAIRIPARRMSSG